MQSPYEKMDKDIKEVMNKTPLMFNQMRLRIAGFDKLNILRRTKKQVSSLYKKIRLELADIYFTNAKLIYPDLTRAEYEAWLDDYYLVTGYVYYNEFQRKEARYYEEIASVIQNDKSLSSADMLKAQRRAVRLLNLQIENYGIYMVDKAIVEELKVEGYTKVKWISQKDNKVCEDCKALDGKIFDIDKIPPKPHLGDRCFVVGVKE